MPLLAAILLLLVQPDSAALVSRARAAQAEFERARMFLLPTGASGGGPCDYMVGRFCYRSSDGDDSLPREPERIAEERSRLIAVLDSVGGAVPGDGWVAGQRVRYLLEAGRPQAAVEAARDCRAAPWWCAALRGLAQHAEGNFRQAWRSFRDALEEMPEEQRCRWNDVAALLEEPLRSRYRRLPCGERQAFEDRLWWLAQPLWSMPGNDRRTEHYARLTMAHLLRDARSPFSPWESDLRELVVRYGWPEAWQVADCRGACQPIPLGYEREPNYHFLPDAREFDSLQPPGDELGSLKQRAARERYAPAYARKFTVLDADVAPFRRGDSTLLVATYDVSSDSLFTGPGRVAALVLERDDVTPPVVAQRDSAGEDGVLVAQAPWRPVLLSVELLAPGRKVAARSRTRFDAVAPSSGDVALSGILPFDPVDSLPADLPDALAHAHAGSVLAGGRIGLYWEAYGFHAGEDVSASVTVSPERRSLLRRIAVAIGLASRSGGVRVEWRETVQPREGRAPRSLVVDLKGHGPGRYRVEVTLLAPGGPPITSVRTIRVAKR